MAFSIGQLANLIRTSIHGRRLGLDPNDFMVGNRGMRVPIQDATSATTATQLQNHGFVSVVTTTDDAWVLADPVPGCQVTLFCGSSSTGTHAITPASAVIVSSNGVAGSSISMGGAGASITLLGVSTAQWAVQNVLGASTGTTGATPFVKLSS
jgi:hypothetical protein